MTTLLDSGNYHPETVPFSFAFTRWKRRTVAIHRTDWNRLDVTDPASGRLLSKRGPTDSKSNEKALHYLEYFHGALHLNPSGSRVADDGWIWQPIGTPSTWDLDAWESNPWESEGGMTRRTVCSREYHWDSAMTWLDDDHLIVGGLGCDDDWMIDGARVFNVRQLTGTCGYVGYARDPGEILNFAGPSGRFFSNGTSLFSANEVGLSRWDPKDGQRTGQLDGFQPSRHHRGAGELATVIDNLLVRWRI